MKISSLMIAVLTMLTAGPARACDMATAVKSAVNSIAHKYGATTFSISPNLQQVFTDELSAFSLKGPDGQNYMGIVYLNTSTCVFDAVNMTFATSFTAN